jgi:uncharacterized membrane protein YheB (UPF0754 family)
MEKIAVRVTMNSVLLQKLRSFEKNEENKRIQGMLVKMDWEELYTERLRELINQLKEQAIEEKTSS